MAVLDQDTDHFNIKVEEAEKDNNNDIRARIHAKPLGTDEEHYNERIKITGRSAKSFAKTVSELHNLNDKKIKQLKVDILNLKNKIQEHIEKNVEDDNQTESQEQKTFYEIMKTIMEAGGQLEQNKVEEALDIENAFNYIDKFDKQMEMIIPVGDNELQITDKGKKELKEHLGFESFDGDPEAEAQEQLKKGDPLQYYLDSFNKIHKGDHLLKTWELISALTCSCADRQIHSWAVGPSGKGKSHLKRRLLDFLPSETYTRKESFSPKALQYKSTTEGPEFLNNKVVYFDEVGEDDVEQAIELMRLMTDQDQETITHETVRDQEILTISLDVSNITVWFTSVETIEDEQLKNRFILTNPDASSAQDETVFEHQQQILNAGGDLDFIPKETPVIQSIIRDIRENTPQYKPIVPFKIDWKQQFNRRLYPFFYTLMGMIAKIHYKNRETRDGYIFVTESDFKLAKLIWGKLIDTTVAQTDEQSIELLKELPDNRANALTRQELRLKVSGFSTRKVKETCDKLEETEELQLINTDYVDGEYVHWAGEDVEKLVDNQPEIEELSENSIIKMIQESGVTPDEEIVQSVLEAETPVYEYLEEVVRKKRAIAEEDEEEKTEITENEEYLLKQFTEFEWGVDLNTISQFHQDTENTPDADVFELAESLEEKDVIRIDKDNKPKAKKKFEKLKAEDEVTI